MSASCDPVKMRIYVKYNLIHAKIELELPMNCLGHKYQDLHSKCSGLQYTFIFIEPLLQFLVLYLLYLVLLTFCTFLSVLFFYSFLFLCRKTKFSSQKGYIIPSPCSGDFSLQYLLF